MTDDDFSTFDRAFRRVCGAFRLKLKPVEVEELTRTYFRVLESYPLEEVLRAGKTCLTKSRKFPRPADWIAELAGALPPCPKDQRQMTLAEMDDLDRAKRLRYRDHPCLCSDCCRAGVDERELRFVPTLRLDEEEERAFNPRRNGPEVVGHWAHGEELRRWYEARGNFYEAVCRLATRQSPLARAVAQAVAGV